MYFVRVTVPPRKVVDRWNEKRAMFGVYDNIGILGKTRLHCTTFKNGSYAATASFSHLWRIVPCSIAEQTLNVAVYATLGTVLSAPHVLTYVTRLITFSLYK